MAKRILSNDQYRTLIKSDDFLNPENLAPGSVVIETKYFVAYQVPEECRYQDFDEHVVFAHVLIIPQEHYRFLEFEHWPADVLVNFGFIIQLVAGKEPFSEYAYSIGWKERLLRNVKSWHAHMLFFTRESFDAK